MVVLNTVMMLGVEMFTKGEPAIATASPTENEEIK
jgi:hypothetical protein